MWQRAECACPFVHALVRELFTLDMLPDSKKKTQEPIVRQGITFRAVMVGLLLVTFLCAVTPYTDLVSTGSAIACSHMPIGVLTLFILLMVIVNPILRRLPLAKPFNSAELITIYVMMLVAAGIPSFGLTEYLFPVVTAPYYFNTPENGWEKTLYQYIPKWFGPTSKSVIKPFYEGLRPGQHIPWGPWIKPLLGWSIFVFALYLVIVCMATILRKQWVERERLSFPLVQVPLEMVRDEDSLGGNSFFKNPLVWVGIMIPVCIHSLNVLHSNFPSVPGINLTGIDIAASLVDKPWSALVPLEISIFFSVIGFAYLLSSEVGLGLWAFYLFYRLQGVVASAIGYQDAGIFGYGTSSFMAHQGAGAFIVIVVYSIWLARRQLAEVARRAFGKGDDTVDEQEPMSYAFAFWGLIIGTIAMVAWCWVAGMNPIIALIMILLFYVIMIALAKVIADGGLLFVQASFRPGDLMTTTVGTSPFSAANLTIMNIIQFIFMYDLRSFLMPSVLDGFRLSDGPRLKRRSLFIAMVIAIAAGVVVSYISTLFWIYRTGGIKMSQWFLIQGNVLAYTRSISQITNPATTNWHDLTFVILGGAFCWLMMFLRQRYVGWPLHPIGYAMGSTLPMYQLWFPIMVGWMIKSLILRYGGRQAYVRFRPIFLGLIVGEFGIAGIWMIVERLLGLPGHMIFG